MSKRLIPFLAIAGALAIAGGSGAGRTLTLQPGQQVHVAGTQIYCGVFAKSMGVMVNCTIVKPGTQTPIGYIVGITDQLVGVNRVVNGSTPTVFIHLQPRLDLPPTGPARAGSGLVTMRLGDAARIAGSHVILFAGEDPQGRPALASAIVTDGNPSGSAADGSYTTGISDREVVILRWQGSKPTIVFRRPQPSA